MRRIQRTYAILDMCRCGHDYGGHDSTVRRSPCTFPNAGSRRPCPCKGFELETGKLAADAKRAAECVAEQLKAGIVAQIVPEPMSFDVAADPPPSVRTKGDDLSLARCAIALERIADQLAELALPRSFRRQVNK